MKLQEQDHAKIEAIGLLALLGITGITDVDEDIESYAERIKYIKTLTFYF